MLTCRLFFGARRVRPIIPISRRCHRGASTALPARGDATSGRDGEGEGDGDVKGEGVGQRGVLRRSRSRSEQLDRGPVSVLHRTSAPCELRVYSYLKGLYDDQDQIRRTRALIDTIQSLIEPAPGTPPGAHPL